MLELQGKSGLGVHLSLSCIWEESMLWGRTWLSTRGTQGEEAHYSGALGIRGSQSKSYM